MTPETTGQSVSHLLTRSCGYELEMINFCALGRGRGVGWGGVGWGGVAQRLHTEEHVRVDLLSTDSAGWWERGGDG